MGETLGWMRGRCMVESGVEEDPCGLAMWAGGSAGKRMNRWMDGLRYIHKSVLSVTSWEGLEGHLQCNQR